MMDWSGKHAWRHAGQRDADAQGRRATYVAGGIALVATVIRVVLAYLTPVTSELAAIDDDGLFVRHAMQIAQGSWLGAYGPQTLPKNPGYALILAMCGMAHVRYQLVYITLYALACLTFAWGLRPRLREPLLLTVVYVVLLFSPLTFTTQYFRRVYRDGMTMAFAMGSVAAYVGLYLRRHDGLVRQIPWAVLAALWLAGICSIKENGLWIVPLVGACTLLSLVAWAGAARRHDITLAALVARMVMVALPVASMVVTPAVIRYQNQRVYGVSLANERFEGSFAQVCAKLVDIEESDERWGIWVSRDRLEQARKASPTLDGLGENLDDAWYYSSYVQFGRDEVYGDLSYWALRNAYERAGGYTDAVAADAFWRKVDNELTAAFESGSLRRETGGVKVSAVAPAINVGDVPVWLGRTKDMVCYLGSFDVVRQRLITAAWAPDLPAPEMLEEELRVRDFLGGNTLLNGTVDDMPQRAHLVNVLDYYVGFVMSWVYKLLALSLPVCTLALCGLCLARRVERPWEPLIMIGGLVLVTLAFELATVWYVSYSVDLGMDIYLREAYKYNAEFFVLLPMVSLLALVEVVDAVLARNRMSAPTTEGL